MWIFLLAIFCIGIFPEQRHSLENELQLPNPEIHLCSKNMLKKIWCTNEIRSVDVSGLLLSERSSVWTCAWATAVMDEAQSELKSLGS